ncbi:MAG: hypothetical protein CL862_04690 [Cyanobium sp. NAT70]|nr:hypothetical protein [Cyanobium sp. NAT70]
MTDPNRLTDLLDQRSRARALRSMRCLPFSLQLFRDLQRQGLDATNIWADQHRYGRSRSWYRHAGALEDDLRWLITVGVLRREVDGQGLTSRFRLTPLGRQLLDDQKTPLSQKASLLDHLRHQIRRFLSF